MMKYTYLIPFLVFSFSCHVTKEIYSIKKDNKVIEYANSITAEELNEHLSVIASDEYEGRETGKKGQRMTAEYLKNELKKAGIEPGNKGSYFQEFPLKELSKPDAYFSLNTNKYSFNEDFYYYQTFAEFTPFEIEQSQIISINYGIETKKLNDYKDINVKDKAVIIKLDKLSDFEEWNWRKKLEIAKNKGAVAVFFTSDNFELNKEKLDHYLNKTSVSLYKEDEEQKKDKSIPFFFISDDFKEELLNKKNNHILSFNSIVKENTIISSNVLGFIEGSDPELKKEIIILTAHYDHLGIIDGEIYNGADDDGTGTVALLELAEAFQKAKNEGNGPKRSILIMPVSGEEKGLLGSQYYTENPVYPIQNTVVDLNIDMIGRIDKKHKNSNYVYLIGADKISKELHEVSEAANKTYTQLELDYTFNDKNDPNRFYYRSDHYNFVKQGVPVIFYFSGVHEDYHKKTDEIEKILFNKVEHITKLVFYTAWEIANKPTRLQID